MSADYKKWISSLVVTVIGGLIIWYLTKPSEENKSYPSGPTPDLRILAFDIPETPAGRGTAGNFTVYNDGDAIAEKCFINWWIGGTMTLSDTFYIKPKETKRVMVKSIVHEHPGKIRSTLYVQFIKSKTGTNSWSLGQSPEYIQYITVIKNN